jgi:hypothetical protein
VRPRGVAICLMLRIKSMLSAQLRMLSCGAST